MEVYNAYSIVVGVVVAAVAVVLDLAGFLGCGGVVGMGIELLLSSVILRMASVLDMFCNVGTCACKRY